MDDRHILQRRRHQRGRVCQPSGFVRLMNMLKPRALFDVLIVSELSRLEREQLETGYACKQLAQAGARIFGYLESREVMLDGATDKFMLSAMNFAAEVEREKARQRVTDAMSRKARAGPRLRRPAVRLCQHTGARRERQALSCRPANRRGSGRRHPPHLCHVCAGPRIQGHCEVAERRRCPDTAAEGGKRAGWHPSSIRALLHSEVYRAVHVWVKRQKADQWGQRRSWRRPESEWIRTCRTGESFWTRHGTPPTLASRSRRRRTCGPPTGSSGGVDRLGSKRAPPVRLSALRPLWCLARRVHDEQAAAVVVHLCELPRAWEDGLREQPAPPRPTG